ncbi:hypothetical protein ACFL2I_04645, partial [Candidatus Omnitrophota bacterium]
LTTEEQKRQLDTVLHFDIPILSPKDRKLCINKLVEGRIISKKDGTEETSKWVEALGIDEDKAEKEKSFKQIYCNFIRLPDNSLVELVYDSSENEPFKLAVFLDGKIDIKTSVTIKDTTYLPLTDELVKKKVVLLPSRPELYTSEKALFEEIRAFIHKYLDVDEFYEKLAVYYVMLTWLYDRFNTVPYLRALGDWGTGKTRFLLVVGSVCYKPIFASGAVTAAPIFRIIERWHGTSIFDEADFKKSEAWEEIIKILNCGYMKGFPVLRCEKVGNSFDVKAYDVFGCKLLANRERFSDKALESRCFTKEMEGGHREDIPVVLPDSFYEEATTIRNKLLVFRFNKFYSEFDMDSSILSEGVESRLKQIIIPILSMVEDEDIKNELREFLRQYNKHIIADRGMTLEADVLGIICDRMKNPSQDELYLKDIASELNSDDNAKKITSKKVGWVVREKLKLPTHRAKDGYRITFNDGVADKLDRLALRYGIREG